jgi:hypothetical protein
LDGDDVDDDDDDDSPVNNDEIEDVSLVFMCVYIEYTRLLKIFYLSF